MYILDYYYFLVKKLFFSLFPTGVTLCTYEATPSMAVVLNFFNQIHFLNVTWYTNSFIFLFKDFFVFLNSKILSEDNYINIQIEFNTAYSVKAQTIEILKNKFTNKNRIYLRSVLFFSSLDKKIKLYNKLLKYLKI